MIRGLTRSLVMVPSFLSGGREIGVIALVYAPYEGAARTPGVIVPLTSAGGAVVWLAQCTEGATGNWN